MTAKSISMKSNYLKAAQTNMSISKRKKLYNIKIEIFFYHPHKQIDKTKSKTKHYQPISKAMTKEI
jgi:hypothetical protein